MAWNYSDKTKQLFLDAVQGKPGSHLGEVADADAIGEHGSIACGDALRFTFKVKRHPSDPTQDVITEAKYLTFGCTLRAERIDGEVICVFESPAPLLRRGGHSQGWDTGAHSVGGFFGRFRAASGYQHEFEKLAADAPGNVTR